MTTQDPFTPDRTTSMGLAVLPPLTDAGDITGKGVPSVDSTNAALEMVSARASNAEAAAAAAGDVAREACLDLLAAASTDPELRRRVIAAELTEASGAPSAWWVSRRSTDAVELIGEIGGGWCWSWELQRDADLPGGFRTALTGRHSLVGVPMVYAPKHEGAFGGSGNWVSSSRLPGASEDGHPGLMAGGMEVVVNTTAGSRNVVPAIVDFPPLLGHRIDIEGAGTGGAVLEGTIGNVTAGNLIVLSPSSPGVAISGDFTARVWPAFTQSASNDATATATWTSPAAATRVGVSAVAAASGGVWSVTIDGDPTAADMAPTGADLLAAGYVTAADMTTGGGPINPGHRYVDFHFPISAPHRPIGLARSLSPAAHTVTLAATGVAHAGGGVNVRALITGWAWGTAATTPATPGAMTFARWWVIPEESAIEFAHELAPSGGSPVFVGSQHGWQDQPSSDLRVTLDGDPVDLSPGQAVTGPSLRVTRLTDLHHPDATGAVAGCRYEWVLIAGAPLLVQSWIDWRQGVTVSAGYPAHCNLDATVLPQGMGDAFGEVVADLTLRDNSYQALAKNHVLAAFGPDLIFTEEVTAPLSATGGWSSNPAVLHSIRARNAGPGRVWAKTYLSRDGSPVPGEVWVAQARYGVGFHGGGFVPPGDHA